MTTITRPALRYHGGKVRLAPWVMQFIPPHHRYVEPFGGATGVLLRKPRCQDEIYNDLDSDITNFFRAVRDLRVKPFTFSALVSTRRLQALAKATAVALRSVANEMKAWVLLFWGMERSLMDAQPETAAASFRSQESSHTNCAISLICMGFLEIEHLHLRAHVVGDLLAASQ